ncbi:aegerolysin type hemolysin [Fusarium tricinctum]|uniref:Aegerolysin type hemolysin n=1 Tax=Fusarium tricinctum TaxID=61284 RepID=A0A8K0W609_9HYPO|nr:aegerolysin type hemolysin [Fusarium tricinctum]
MAYGQWVYILIQSKIASGNISVKNVNIMWGKFYKYDDKDNEISPQDVGNIVIPSNGSAGIASCGRSDAASGTEGTFDLYDGDVKICNIYWSDPWGGSTNIFTVSNVNDSYIVQATGATLEGGPLGNVNVRIGKF